MKPAVCCICGTSTLDEKFGKKGDWVKFDNYRNENSDSLTHPTGLEYFCSEHFFEASQLAHIDSDDALSELEGIFVS